LSLQGNCDFRNLIFVSVRLHAGLAEVSEDLVLDIEMKGTSNEVFGFAQAAMNLLMFVAVRQKVLLTFTADKGGLRSCSHFVHLQMVKPFDMLDEVIIFLCF
jgi:hypothetical protein